MVMICHCAGVSDKDLESAIEAFRVATYGGLPESRKDLEPLIGDYKEGCCRRIFDRALQQVQETGEFNLFSRSRRKQEEGTSGLCSKAASHDYTSGGVPNLRDNPTDGVPNMAAE